MAQAKQQVWYLARDSLRNGGHCVLSRHPLYDETGGPYWFPRAPHEREYKTIEYELFKQLTDDKYKLRPGAEPRKVWLRPLGVKEVKP